MIFKAQGTGPVSADHRDQGIPGKKSSTTIHPTPTRNTLTTLLTTS